jgi:hypothetical protein
MRGHLKRDAREPDMARSCDIEALGGSALESCVGVLLLRTEALAMKLAISTGHASYVADHEWPSVRIVVNQQRAKREHEQHEA